MDWGLWLSLALIWVLSSSSLFALSAAFRKNRWGERRRGRRERMGWGLLGLLLIAIIVAITLIVTTQ